MYDWDDILIVGDSWCSKRSNYDHWPKLLFSELTNNDNNEPRGKGYSGCAWWSIRKRLLAELQIHVPKLLIICHTDCYRIPNDYDKPITPAGAFSQKKHKQFYDGHLYKAAELYYTHLYSKEFHLWSEQQWFYELDYILEKYNIEKTIHLFGIPLRNKLFNFKNGITIKDPLARYFMRDTNSISWDNHMTPENNHNLAYSLIDIIKKYPNNSVYEKELMSGGNNDIIKNI